MNKTTLVDCITDRQQSLLNFFSSNPTSGNELITILKNDKSIIGETFESYNKYTSTKLKDAVYDFIVKTLTYYGNLNLQRD